MPEWVFIVHKDLKETFEAPPLVTKEAYDEVWKPNGWRLAPKASTELAEISATKPKPATKKRR